MDLERIASPSDPGIGEDWGGYENTLVLPGPVRHPKSRNFSSGTPVYTLFLQDQIFMIMCVDQGIDIYTVYTSFHFPLGWFQPRARPAACFALFDGVRGRLR